MDTVINIKAYRIEPSEMTSQGSPNHQWSVLRKSMEQQDRVKQESAPLYKRVFYEALSRIELSKLIRDSSPDIHEHLSKMLSVPLIPMCAIMPEFNKVFYITETWGAIKLGTIDVLLDALYQLRDKGTGAAIHTILLKLARYCDAHGIQYKWTPLNSLDESLSKVDSIQLESNKNTEPEVRASNHKKTTAPVTTTQRNSNNRALIDLTESTHPPLTVLEALQSNRKTSINTLPTRLVSITTTTLPEKRRIVIPKSSLTTRKRVSSETKRAPKEEDDSKSCIICMTATKDVLYLPCRHMQVCSSCDDSSKIKECPMCRNPIDQRIVAFL
jgi:hypothetical protein